jgi:hypothetical protein
MTRLLPWLVMALMIGIAASLGVDAVQARQLSRQRADSMKVLAARTDSLERAILFLETERLQTSAKLRADSIATAEASKAIGPVVSRDTVTKTAIIVIEGVPTVAPLQLVERDEARGKELVDARIHIGVLEALVATERDRADTAEEKLRLERANRPSRIQRLLSDGRKVLLGAGLTFVLLVL